MADGAPNLADFENAMDGFEKFITGDKSKNHDGMRENWIYLQMFATYGIRLPFTEADLKTSFLFAEKDTALVKGKKLKDTDFAWLPSLSLAYTGVNKSSRFFHDTVLQNMIDLSSGLTIYSDESGGKGNEFELLIELMDGGEDEHNAVLDILKTRGDKARANSVLAKTVLENLKEYHAKLIVNQTAVQASHKEIAKDEKVSDDAIKLLDGDADTDGSIKNIMAKIKHDKSVIEHDKLMLETSAAYAWATIVGLIAAATVWGVYGKEWKEMSDDIDRLDGKLKSANEDLSRAMAVHAVNTQATDSLEKLLGHLVVAIEKSDAVHKSWNGVVQGIDYLSAQISGSMKSTGPTDDKLRSNRQVKHYMKHAAEKWTALKPIVEQVSDNIIISVDPTELSLKDMAARIRAGDK
ncbi:hypothetical protein shim_00710 [Shimia sp. SK013]|uniref:hypothetical protein n=1 Tax=Shimia sp. SK013 TaxID=1389006 RepID=UPI0006B4186D|nr:hypothetical protein [Shimia sp. SK013]KPA23463.1 hypothetical protein shim_00710 [Shimia sp. SK013]